MPPNDDAYVWIGPLAGSWATAGNWEDTTSGADPALRSPATSDVVTFNSPATQFQVIGGVGSAASVAFNGDDAIAGTLDVGGLTLNTGSLEVQAGATLQATTALLGSASFPEYAGLTVSGSGAAAYFGTLDLDAIFVTPLTVTDGGFVQTDNLVLGGVFAVAIGIDSTSTFEIGTAGTAAPGVLTIDPGHTLTAAVPSTINAVVVNNGGLQVQSLTANGLAGSGVLQVAQGGVLSVDGAILGSQAISLAGDTQLILGSAYQFAPTAETISATSSITLTGNGDVIVFNNAPGDTALAPISGFNSTDALIVSRTVTAAKPTAGGLLLQAGAVTVGTVDLVGNYSGDRLFALPFAEMQPQSAQTEIVLAPTATAPVSAGTAGNTFVWSGPIAGDWNNAANWTDQTTGTTPAAVAPGGNDTVVFNGIDAAAQVIFGQGNAAIVTFNGDNSIVGSLTAGTLTQNSGILEVAAGATLQATIAQVGSAAFPEEAGLSVTGAGAVALFGTLDEDGIFVDPLSVTDGADLQTASLVLGGTGQSSEITVDATSRLEIGTAGTAAAGALTIDPGSSLVVNDSYIDSNIVNNGNLQVHSLNVNGLAGAGTLQVSTGGVLTDYGPIFGSQAITLGAGAQLVLGEDEPPNTLLPTPTSSATSSLLLAGPGDIITLNTPPGRNVLSPISGFNATDTLIVSGTITAALLTSSGLLLQDGTSTVGTLDLIGSYAGDSFQTVPLSAPFPGLANQTEVLLVPELACYVEGTHIATSTGPRPIENLRPGDRLLLADGGSRPVVWLGHRRVDCRRHPRPRDVWPVCVRAGAFGPGRPHRDLLLSLDHAIFIDGFLIPVRYLVDGRAILQVQRAAVTYWHVELDCHDVILAEGLACESYLDTGTRAEFAGGRAISLHADIATRTWEASGCAPLVVAGPEVEAARRLLRGWQGPPSGVAARPACAWDRGGWAAPDLRDRPPAARYSLRRGRDDSSSSSQAQRVLPAPFLASVDQNAAPSPG